jgi:hypothetical protein
MLRGFRSSIAGYAGFNICLLSSNPLGSIEVSDRNNSLHGSEEASRAEIGVFACFTFLGPRPYPPELRHTIK